MAESTRRCLNCGHQGFMRTWLGHYNLPQFIAIVLLLFWVVPGLVFIAWCWGKYKCPKCGKVGNNVVPSVQNAEARPDAETSQKKKCPYCAELIQSEAIVCRWCKNSLSTSTADDTNTYIIS